MVSVQILALAVALSNGGETVLLDFHAPWCAPCRSMDGTIAALEQAGYPVRKVNIDRERNLAAQYQRARAFPASCCWSTARRPAGSTGAVRRDELADLFAKAGVGPHGWATPDRPRPVARSPGRNRRAGGPTTTAIRSRQRAPQRAGSIRPRARSAVAAPPTAQDLIQRSVAADDRRSQGVFLRLGHADRFARRRGAGPDLRTYFSRLARQGTNLGRSVRLAGRRRNCRADWWPTT